MNISAKAPQILLITLALCALYGLLPASCRPSIRQVEPHYADGSNSTTLFVVVHGLSGAGRMHPLRDQLLSFGDVLLLDFPAWSNARPDDVSAQISTLVQAQSQGKNYQKIVIVGFSMGALLARRAFLEAARTGKPWSTIVTRFVLLAGMNRGWSLSGPRPSDMRWHTHTMYAVGAWLANLTRSASLIMSMQTGTPFVADLRLDWMRHFRQTGVEHPEVVQLLGDIDEIVSAGDNEDLAAAPQGDFAWLRVRGTNHREILSYDDTSDHNIGQYRLAKVMLAATACFSDIRGQSEVLPSPSDPAVTKLVFILHGIRDLGRWSSTLESDLRKRHDVVMNGKGKLMVESMRYGYFGMGQFLMKMERDYYVRWFMDEYTEAVARYPKTKEIDFIGHSNGTYLFTRALKDYRSLNVDRAVLAGSVAPRDYAWAPHFENGQVKKVRNYVAKDDLVVALLPRFFENRPRLLFGDEIGSAGYNGFNAADHAATSGHIENFKFLTGGHGAFTEERDGISEFIIPTPGAALSGRNEKRQPNWLTVASDYFTVALWAAMALVLVLLGIRVAEAAGSRAPFALLAYLFLLWQVLRWA
ncbi:alpha/beta hydrolase [Massilia atriviolacea]|nr:alpha/beta hydrolase [Massilia atriviolacea]